MTQRRKAPRRRKKIRRRVFLAGLGGAALAAGAYIVHCSIQNGNESKSPTAPEAAPEPNPALPSGEWRAVWVSYLEWARMDFSSEEAFRTAAAELLDNSAALGLNTVIAQVRPFGDALYESSLFPWSHLCTGTQGQGPGFDPLDVLVTEAHGRGLSLEAWVNPYRLKSSAAMPPSIADTNLMNTHPEWCCTVGDGVYLNPAVPEAAAYVVQGVAELVEKYAVDGIHFDDYFYPTDDESIDAEQYAAYVNETEEPLTLHEWRTANVNALIAAVYSRVKEANENVQFGISPQGNLENNEMINADVYTWCAQAGYIDYVCPQLYYSFENEALPFETALQNWCALKRLPSIKLYIGLAVYKAGTDADNGTWLNTTDTLAKQIDRAKEAGADGVVLYAVDHLTGENAKAEMANAVPELERFKEAQQN